MARFFLIGHIGLVIVGILLLLYYAKWGGKLNLDLIKQVPHIPRAVKIYALLLLIWIAISSTYYFIDFMEL